MNQFDLLKAIGGADDALLDACENYSERKNMLKRRVIWRCAAVACVAVLTLGALTLPYITDNSSVSNADASPSNVQSIEVPEIIYNDTPSILDAKFDIPGAFTEPLDEKELAAVLPQALPKQLKPSASALFNGRGELMWVTVDMDAPDDSMDIIAHIERGGITRDYFYSGEVVPTVIGDTQFSAMQNRAEDELILIVTFEKGDIFYELTMNTTADLEGQAKKLLSELMVYYSQSPPADLDSINYEYIPEWKNEKLTMEQAKLDSDFGAYMPPFLPDGFSEESITRVLGQNTDHLSGLWCRGMNDLHWHISRFSENDRVRLVSADDTESYDLSLYPIPRVESVPEELYQTVYYPIFDIEELTLDVVERRSEYSDEQGDSGRRVNLAVHYGDIIVEVNAKGVEPQTIYEMLVQIEK